MNEEEFNVQTGTLDGGKGANEMISSKIDINYDGFAVWNTKDTGLTKIKENVVVELTIKTSDPK